MSGILIRAGAPLLLMTAALAWNTAPPSPAPTPSPPAVTDTLRIAFFTGLDTTRAAARSALKGALLAEAEGRRTAALLGRSFELLRVQATSPDSVLIPRGTFAAVGGFDAGEAAALARAAEARGVVYVNIGATPELLGAERCARHVFHVYPSDAMRRRAAGDRAPGLPAGAGNRDEAAVAEGARPPRAVMWQASLARYGALQLNERYQAHAGEPMDEAAWAAWFAVKLLLESALRVSSTDAAALIGHLQSPNTSFDGHKGRRLSFRPWDHELRQPLYLVAPDANSASEVLREVPPADRTRPVAEVLDSLVGPLAESPCGR